MLAKIIHDSLTFFKMAFGNDKYSVCPFKVGTENELISMYFKIILNLRWGNILYLYYKFFQFINLLIYMVNYSVQKKKNQKICISIVIFFFNFKGIKR